MISTPKNVDRKNITQADMIPKNILVLYREGDAIGKDVAEYYQLVRNVPSDNIQSYNDPLWSDSTLTATEATCNNFVNTVGALCETRDVKTILLCGHFPSYTDIPMFSGFNWAFSGIAALSYWLYKRQDVRWTIGLNDFIPDNLADYSLDNRHPAFTGAKVTSDANQIDKPTMSKMTVPNSWLTDTDISKDKSRQVPVFRIDCSLVDIDDTRIVNPSRLNYCKRFIDDAIAAENAEYSDIGNVVLTSSSSANGFYPPSEGLNTLQGTYWTALAMSYKNIYTDMAGTKEPVILARSQNLGGFIGALFASVSGNHLLKQEPSRFNIRGSWLPDTDYEVYDLIFEAGAWYECDIAHTSPSSFVIAPNWTSRGVSLVFETDAVEPTWGTPKLGQIFQDGDLDLKYIETNPANNFPLGASAVVPYDIGKTFIPIDDVFFMSHGVHSYLSNVTEPEQNGNYIYRQGAIASWSQSLGALPLPAASLDPEFSVISGFTTASGLDCLSPAKNAARISNGVGHTVRCGDVQYIGGGAATATISTSGNDVSFFVDGVEEAFSPITTSGTWIDRFKQLVAGVNANWSVAMGLAGSPDSRCMSSLKNGACIAIGAESEPTTHGAPKMATVLQSLRRGSCMGEAMFKEFIMANWHAKQYCAYYGDPLYRPFGHIK